MHNPQDCKGLHKAIFRVTHTSTASFFVLGTIGQHVMLIEWPRFGTSIKQSCQVISIKPWIRRLNSQVYLGDISLSKNLMVLLLVARLVKRGEVVFLCSTQPI